jgi:polyvinyl alcohol dehydrogenase (cytochrome)
MRFGALFFATALSTAFLSAASRPGQCSGDPKPFSPGTGDWNGWGVDQVNSRYQPQPALSAADIPKLKLKWAVGFPGDMRAVGQPAIVGGRVFVGSQKGVIYSLDAATGCIYWTYDAGNITRTALMIVRAGNPARWVVFFGDSGGSANALDAQTGQSLWKTKLDDHIAARITGTPIFHKGRLYVPVASGEELMSSNTPKYECCKFRGSLAALDANTGRLVWKTFTVTDPAKQYKTNSEGTAMYGPAGAGIWSAPTIDEKRKRVYVGTGNSFTGIDIHTSDAIVAFDLDNGRLLWANQVTPGDNWVPGCPKGVNCPENPGDDYDFGESPILRTLPGGKQILLAGQKSGLVYGLDPDQQGKIVWKTRLGQGTGLMGGIAWGMAADPQTLYAAVSDINRPDGTPGLYALRIDNGEKIWSTPAPKGAGNPAQAAAITAIPGAVFSASIGGRLRAYSSKTGEIIWDFNAQRDFETVNQVPAKGGSFNGGGAAVAHGMVITSCGYGFAGGVPGNVLLAFAVDGK